MKHNPRLWLPFHPHWRSPLKWFLSLAWTRRYPRLWNETFPLHNLYSADNSDDYSHSVISPYKIRLWAVSTKCHLFKLASLNSCLGKGYSWLQMLLCNHWKPQAQCPYTECDIFFTFSTSLIMLTTKTNKNMLSCQTQSGPVHPSHCSWWEKEAVKYWQFFGIRRQSHPTYWEIIWGE